MAVLIKGEEKFVNKILYNYNLLKKNSKLIIIIYFRFV